MDVLPDSGILYQVFIANSSGALVCMGHYVLNGLVPEGVQSVSSFSSAEYETIWIDLEHKTAELLHQIQPSLASEERRKSVVNYLERLIGREFNCKARDISTIFILMQDKCVWFYIITHIVSLCFLTV
jgi:hypothetical protein